MLVHLDGLLESLALQHNLLVLHRYHAIVHIRGELLLLGLLLVAKARITRSKRILLVALADLEAHGAHFILHQLVVQVAAWAWVLPYLL